MIKPVIAHSITRATEEAIKLWSFASAQYPAPATYPQISNTVAGLIIESVGVFALNSRRALDLLPYEERISLLQPRWIWTPKVKYELVLDFRDALNRIIHAEELDVGFEAVPNEMSIIDNGAVVVPYVMAVTDRKPQSSFIDVFSISYAFLYDVLPRVNQLSK